MVLPCCGRVPFNNGFWILCFSTEASHGVERAVS